MKAVVLAAGKGIRMKPLTDSAPKAMVELKGKPLLEWHLEALAEAGITEIAIITGYLPEKTKNFFGNSSKGIPITYLQQEEQLGTAHAIGLAEKFVGKENFLVSYCDVLIEAKFIKKFLEFTQKNPKKFGAIIAVRKVNDVSRFGAIEAKGNIVKSLIEKPFWKKTREKPKEKKAGLINAGFYWFSPKIFFAIKKTKKSKRGEFEITDSLKKFIRQKKLGCFELQGKCLDIGTIEELKKAELEI